MPTVVENGVTGYVDTSVAAVIERMRELLGDRDGARRIGQAAREYAHERFGIGRFGRDWDDAFEQAIGLRHVRPIEPAGQAAAR